MEAQRYPADFDAVIAGAPADPQTHLHAWRIAAEAKILQSPASVVPLAKLALLNRAVLAACDAIDGVTDGLLTDPRQCPFDPATLLCRGPDRDDCLTAQQLEAVKMGYAPARRTTGQLIFPGLVPGGETGWTMLTGAEPEPGSIDVGMFRFVAHEDPAWDWRTFDLDRDTSLIDKKAGFIDAVNPDLSAFRARGAKTSHLSWLERWRIRRGDLSAEHCQLLCKYIGKNGIAAAGLAAAVHGTRYGALRRWAGTRPSELDGRARALARVRNRTRSIDCVAC